MSTSDVAGDATMGGGHTVVGAFDGPNHAEQAHNGLQAAGFAPEQVSVVAKDARDTRQLAEHSDMVAEDAGTGAVAGGLLGGLGGFLVGISSLVIPGIGPIVGAGILAATLVGAGVGAAVGGLVGALVGMGVPEEHARGYEEHVRRGRVLMTVQAADAAQAERARALFAEHGGADVRAYPAAAAAR
ncbi:MAG TPA: general stress protein [Thermomicrobiales bacterium]|nr:general stress protein [Thermomicrobiales bacterium]